VLNTLPKRLRPCHRQADRGAGCIVAEIKQNFRVPQAVIDSFNRGGVTPDFRQINDSTIEPPCQRVEPKDGSIYCCERRNVKVTAADVRVFMRYYRSALHWGPTTVCHR
jgi:hypothetical protein